MSMRRDRVIQTTLAVLCVASGSALALEPTPTPTPTPPAPKPWANETELSIVFTQGNSDTNTVGFKDTLTRRWSDASFRLKLEALRSDTSDDWFEQVDPGFTWLPGESAPPTTSKLVKPKSEPDVGTYFVEGRYDRTIRKSLNWHAGLSWDRNMDAGILGRTIVFGGLGNLWWDRDDLKFQTSYGLSWTDRKEETPDPEKEEQFTGVRLGWTFRKKFGEVTTYTNDWTNNVSIADTNDWSSDMTNAVSVSMSKRLSLRVSLVWMYNHEPALEDVDVVARVVVRDPDGIPGNGDEFFETVTDGGYEVVVGETRVRKEKLDQIFKTTLVVSF
jgi:hypothetical protein